MHRPRQHHRHRVGPPALDALAGPHAVPLQTGLQVRPPGRVRLVVDLAREVVEGVDRHPLVGWERDEAPVEVLRLAARHLLAVPLGLAEAWSRSRADHLRRLPHFGSARFPPAARAPLSRPWTPGAGRDRSRSRPAGSSRGLPGPPVCRALAAVTADPGPASPPPRPRPADRRPPPSRPAPLPPLRRTPPRP